VSDDRLCTSCGRPLRMAASFCTFCGSPVGGSQTGQGAAPGSAPVLSSDSVPTSAVSSGRRRGWRIGRALRMPVWSLVVILVLVGAAAIVGTYFLTRSTGESEETPTASDRVAAEIVALEAGGLPADAVARVGQTYITQEELDKRVQEFAIQFSVGSEGDDPELWAQFERDTLEYLVTYELVVQKAGEYDLSVTDAEVQTQIDTIIADYYGGDQSAFDAGLTAMNMTLDQFELSCKEELLMQKVYDKVTESVATVSEADIAAYFEAHKFDYYAEETRTARHILIAPGANGVDASTAADGSMGTTAALTDADWDAALATAQNVRSDLVGGADWATEAAQYSDDLGTKEIGGDLGAIVRGDLVFEFEDAVFSLQKDEISQPVWTSYGYHIIQVTGITPAGQSNLDEVRDEISTTILDEEKLEVWNGWIAATKAELGVVYKTAMDPAITTTTTARPPWGVSPNLHGDVDDLLKTAGSAAAIAYISDSVHIGDFFMGPTTRVTDIDLWVEGQDWVIGDGTPLGPNYELTWYNDAGGVVARLLLSVQEGGQ
jgi:parvulin-like peptidyl-prolyl isomerase